MASAMMHLFLRDNNQDYRDQCTLQTCPLDLSYWAYLPSLAANSLFLALFSLSLALYLIQALLSRRFLGFTIAMLSGCALEVLGYIGRLMSRHNPFNQSAYLLQIVTLTIAPAFMAAAIYFTLSRIVTTFGAANSRLPPLWYPRVFIPCDVVSLLLQAGGGGAASVASHTGGDIGPGDHVMVAGLAFQVLTLAIFIALVADFAWRTYTRQRAMGEEALDPAHAKLRQSRRFRGFLFALALATLCIFTRCVYRVAELSEGWNGHLIETQRYFIGLEGAIVGAAVLALNAFHPGLCFREGYEERGGFGFGKKKVVFADGETEKVNANSGHSSEGEVAAKPVMETVGEI
ncbi:RTA1-domain-containing protein [Viridothelium virens]|uniref:RTA1-domain-containing protein n=1 Tax=Viridothelium virens TaxID=1048519 RepID=A0A6A6H284_VIRVR|nr:RTA1-domain-containing protein [Viridothelium virens]